METPWQFQPYFSPTSALLPLTPALRNYTLLQPYFRSTSTHLQPYFSPTPALLQPYFSSTSALLQLAFGSTSALLQPYFSPISTIPRQIINILQLIKQSPSHHPSLPTHLYASNVVLFSLQSIWNTVLDGKCYSFVAGSVLFVCFNTAGVFLVLLPQVLSVFVSGRIFLPLRLVNRNSDELLLLRCLFNPMLPSFACLLWKRLC